MAASSAGRARRRPAVSPKARRTFLEAVSQAYSVTYAASQAGVIRARFYELRDTDPAFAAEWAQAYEKGADVIRDEVRRRAVTGWPEPVFQGGKLVGEIRKFSDRLLELEAKRRDPGYRDNHRVELTGPEGGPVQVEDRSASLADVAKVLKEAGALPTDGS